MSPSRLEESLKTILDGVHPYKITEPKEGNKDQRWSTYVADPTKVDGRRKVFKNSKSELFAYLISFYGLAIESELTFGEWFEKYMAYEKLYTTGVKNSKKAKSITTITRHIRDYNKNIKGTILDSTKLSAITKGLVETVLAEIVDKRNLKESYVSNLFGCIRGALEYAYTEERIATNVGALLDKDLILAHAIPPEVKQDEERIFNKEQITALYQSIKAQIDAHPTYLPNYGILLALYTGMRVGEIAALRWSDIDDLYIHIDHSEHRVDYTSHEEAIEQYDNLKYLYEWVMPKEVLLRGNGKYVYTVGEPKRKKHRNFPMTHELRALFAKIRALNLSSGDAFIFVTKDGDRHAGHDLSCAISRRGKEAGFDQASIHRLRRTFSSEAQTKYPREMVASILGHLEETNSRCYDYDTSMYNMKLAMVSNVYSNVLKNAPVRQA